ncbi:MAG: hypothetical protein H5T61_14545, partial [Thermoflexales bacterium]|nr:hypothetical protein [Thermoflexales bacterium]
MGRTPPGRAEFYTQIRERNAKRWGTDRLRIVQAFGRDLRATVRDMILELVQNAEDARAQNLGFRLYDQGLLVWNNGICFSDKDVESISGLLISTKDARSIGHFGIGFKSVLLVTRTPYVLSGSHVFRLEQALDPYPVDSEDELPSEAWGLFQAGKTVFWLPCTGTSSAYEISRAFEQDLTELLLFMRSLKEICWESQTARTVYTSVSQVVFQEEGEESQEIHIRRQQDGDREHICTQWLRLDWQIAIPDPVIQDIVARLQSEEDVEGAQRWEKLSPDARRQMFSLAIALEGGKPRPLEGRAFARLPTGYRTGLKFHVSGRFATTVDRDRLRKDDPLTQWALAETERMLSQMPERLKRSGWFTPPMWAIFPVQKDDQSLFAQAVDTLRKTLSEGVYFHGDDKKLHPKTDVYLAHSRDLYGLLNVSALQEVTGNPNARWIHYELCEGETREVARSLGVPSVESHHVLRWLQSKEAAWFEARPDKWLEQLYRYLASHEELRSGAKELPVVRLHTHRCVRPSEALLPTKQLPEALEPYKRYLPVVDSSLIQDEKTAEALRRLGVKEFDTDLALRHFLQATYGGESKPSVEENREHIRMLFALWKQGELPPRALQNWSSLPILRTRAGTYVAPNQAYLPAGLGGLKEVEEYFHLAGIDRFVAEDYANPEESKDQWREFLEKLGVVHLPRSGAYQCELESWEVDEWIGERELFKKNGKDKIKTVPQT